jgi:hypothetical protein
MRAELAIPQPRPRKRRREATSVTSSPSLDQRLSVVFEDHASHRRLLRPTGNDALQNSVGGVRPNESIRRGKTVGNDFCKSRQNNGLKSIAKSLRSLYLIPPVRMEKSLNFALGRVI